MISARRSVFGQTAAVAVTAAVAGAGFVACSSPPPHREAAAAAAPTEDNVELTPSQLKAVNVSLVSLHTFSPERTAVGDIDFDEDRAVQVSPSYQGRISAALAEVGDRIKKGAPLYAIFSPDLLQAESTLLTTQGVYDLTTKALERARKLRETQGLAEKDYEQAISDQMTADAALKAARGTVAVFGKSEAEIDKIISQRKVDPVLVVTSPLTGKVTARNAQPGLLVQPGVLPAPFAVADVSTLWMTANVAEADAPMFRKGQEISVKVDAFPDRAFSGKVAVVGATVDPTVHTEMVRTEVKDPDDALRPGMLATFVIHTGAPVSAPALPLNAVVRNGDGSMSIWVTYDDRHFTRRTVTLGQQQDGFDQVVSGVKPGERVVSNGAVFLSNMANAAASGDD